jgi:hypothetical protein
MVFKQPMLYKTILVLIRVDSHIDDKDIRHKARLMASFKP